MSRGATAPQQTGWQWPAPRTSLRPDSWALPVRVRTRTRRITRDRPRCAARSPLYPVSRFDSSVFSICDQPTIFLSILPGPGDTGELSRHEGQATVTAHPVRFAPPGGSSSWDPAFDLPTSQQCIFRDAFFQADTLRQGKVSRKVSGGTCEMLRGGLQDFFSPSTSRRAKKKKGKSQQQGENSRSRSKHASRGNCK